MRKRVPSIVILCLSLLIGIFVGMLFSPGDGEKLRSLILYQLKKLVRRIYNIFLGWIDALQPHHKLDNSAKAAGQEVVDSVMQKARKLLAEVEDLSDQFDAKK